MKEHELLLRVFKLISDNHFRDHKMIKEYCTPVKFDRSLGDDIANYVQGSEPQYYHKKKTEFNNRVVEA